MKIAYTKATLSALESLQLQAQHNVSQAVPKSEFNRDKAVEQLLTKCSMLTKDKVGIASTIDFYETAQNKLPTAYEDPIDYPKLVAIFGLVTDAALGMGYDLPNTVSIGTIPSGELNAHVLSVGDKQDEYLMVFNRQLFLFVHLFADYIAWLISNEIRNYSVNKVLTPRKPTDLEIKKLYEIVFFLLNTAVFSRDSTGGIDLIVIADRPKLDIPIINTDEVGNAFKEMMVIPMISFAIGHELTHLHLRYRKHMGDTIEFNSPFKEELHCDNVGFRLAVQTATNLYKGTYPQGWQKFATVASVIFLSCLDITEKAAYVWHTGRKPPKIMENIDTVTIEKNKLGSYPTALFRLQLVYSALRVEVERACASAPWTWVFENSDWIDTFFMDSWGNLRELLLDRYTLRKKTLDKSQRLVDQLRGNTEDQKSITKRQ